LSASVSRVVTHFSRVAFTMSRLSRRSRHFGTKEKKAAVAFGRTWYLSCRKMGDNKSLRVCLKATMDWLTSCRISFLGRRKRWKASREFTWSELLSLRGPELWRARKETFVGDDKEKARDVVYLLVGSSSSRPRQRVCVICEASYFQMMEREEGMDKPQDPQSASSSLGCPLTRTVGDEWMRQRSLMTKALSVIKERSLKAVATLNFDDICK